MIKNKYESDYLIKKLELNRMLEGIFTESSHGSELEKFLINNPYEFYNIRDKSQSSGKFLYKLTADEVLKESENYKVFAVYESLADADSKLILQGDIQINKDFTVMTSLSDIKGISNRVAMQHPVYNLNLDLVERREPSIRGLTQIIDYIIGKQLFNLISEFSLFEIPVGINKEDIIIWELRNY